MSVYFAIVPFTGERSREPQSILSEIEKLWKENENKELHF
jgi:hypothetical protein